MVRFVFRLLLIFIPYNLLAQVFAPNPDWRFENFNSQNHFISRQISDLTIDKHGYVWTCGIGVQRFDGFKTIDFNSFGQSKGSLRENYTDIIADNNGRVWVSSAGLCYYDDASGKFIYVQPGSKHNITYAYAFFIQKNYLWFVCDYGLAKLDTRTLKISYTSLSNIKDPLCTYLIDENTLLISSREKVYFYHIKKNEYSTETLIYNHFLLKIFAVTKRGDDVFLGTSKGLFTLKNLKNISLVIDNTKDITINDLLFLPWDKGKKYLFLATEGKGLLIYNIVLKKIEFAYVHHDNNPFSLPDNIIAKLYADKTGNLWFCTGTGISQLDFFNQQWKIRYLTKTITDDGRINKVARDNYDSSKVWMSSNKAIMRVNWKTKKVEKLFYTNPEMQKIYDFVQLSENKWVLVTPEKIMEWNPESGIQSQRKLPVPDSLGLVYSIRRVIKADANTCFITTSAGLYKYDLITHKASVAAINTSSKKEAEMLKYDLLNGFYDNGVLWIASRNGLFSYNILKQATTIYNGKEENHSYFFFDAANAGKDKIVCGSLNGIAIFNKRTKKFKVINSIANLFKPACVAIVAVNNVVWVGGNAGMLSYGLDTHLSANAEYTTQLTQVFPTSPLTIIGNDIVFGFRNGYAYFKSGQEKISVPSGPLIESLYVNNQPVLKNYTTATGTSELVLSYFNNSINIAFTAFLYADPDHINFRYRLIGADKGWQYSEDQRSANYASLEPGSYTFYVQSGNKNGGWNNHLTSLSFIINPPYWQTWWFRILIVLVIALALNRLYSYRIKNILAIQQVREKIASDLHDEIGSALSSISIFSEVADKQVKEQSPPEKTIEVIGRISFQSRAMLEAMDDIIWAVNPQNDHFNDLAIRMREFAIPLLEARNIEFDIKIDEGLMNARLKMEARKNIFLIFKECVNNIIKHSDCTAMKLSVSKLNNQLDLLISDNGKGFDISAPTGRNGLKNMRKRAADIKGTIDIISRPGNGTFTRLLVDTI